jgi:ribosomal protein L29
MKIKELREKSEVELDRMLVDLRNKLRELRFRIAAKQLGNIREVRKVRQTIAQILTLRGSKKPAAKEAGKTTKA